VGLLEAVAASQMAGVVRATSSSSDLMKRLAISGAMPSDSRWAKSEAVAILAPQSDTVRMFPRRNAGQLIRI
jgi:hypothetical protein